MEQTRTYLCDCLVSLAGPKQIGNFFTSCEALCREFFLQENESTDGKFQLALEAVDIEGRRHGQW